MIQTHMRTQRTGVIVAVVAAMLAAVNCPVVSAGAQVSPPAPPGAPSAPRSTPRAPRPPRPPRAPHTWFTGGDSGVTKIDTVVSFSANGTVDLSLISGSMKLSTWNRNQVRVVASTTGEPSLQFDATGSQLSLEQVKNSWRSGRDDGNTGRATYDVTVPAGVRATLSAISGSVDASGIRGHLEVSNVSGSVNVREIGSSLSVESVSGAVTAANVASDVRIENVSGRISLANTRGALSVETVSGSIVIDGATGQRVHATTVSGSIDFTGVIFPTGRYEFETHSGGANLALAGNSNAAVSVETFSGSVRNDFPGVVRRRNADPEDDRTNFDYVIGQGAGRVRVETFSGSVHISQRNP